MKDTSSLSIDINNMYCFKRDLQKRQSVPESPVHDDLNMNLSGKGLCCVNCISEGQPTSSCPPPPPPLGLRGHGLTCYIILLQVAQSSWVAGEGFQPETIE